MNEYRSVKGLEVLIIGFSRPVLDTIRRFLRVGGALRLDSMIDRGIKPLLQVWSCLRSFVLVLSFLTLPVSLGLSVEEVLIAATEQPEMADMSEAELATLDRFLSLTDDELEQIELAVGRIRQMSPAERAAFREQILSYRKLPSSERVALRQSWGQSSAQERDLWREMMHALPVEQRNEVRDEMQSLAPGERAEFRSRLVREWQEERAE